MPQAESPRPAESAPTRVLIIDDDRKLCRLIADYLDAMNYSVSAVHTGPEGVRAATEETWSAVILDVMLPELDGFEVLKQIRRKSAVPVLMLTARGDEADRIVGLELGADDYVTKPFSPRELVLRVNKILRRGQPDRAEPDTLRFGHLLIDTPRHIIQWRGKPVELTSTEFKLLALLAKRCGRVQSREQLLRDVWEYNTMVDTRTVDTHMRRLREKLGPAARHLETVRGVGYRFVEAAP